MYYTLIIAKIQLINYNYNRGMVNMNNDQIMGTLLTYDNLKELRYENNILYYGNESVNLENINLADFFATQYSQMYVDQRTISAQDFFNIMKLHAVSIEPTDEEIQKERDIDDLEKYALNMLSNIGGEQ